MADKLKGKTILAVDDEPDMREAYKEIFSAEGAEVTVANDGNHALFCMEATGFDAIITDLKMPNMNGIMFLSHVKLNKHNKRAAIFVVSGFLDADAVKKIASAGIATALSKPFDTKSLVATVSKAIEKKKGPPKDKSYDARIINSFVDGVAELMEYYLGSRPAIGKPALKKDEFSSGYLTSMIAFFSEEVMGSMSITFDAKFLGLLAKKLFGDNPVELDDETLADMTGEMCNQVLGRVRINFEKLGLKLRIGLPEVVIGKKHKIIHKVHNPIVAVPITHEGTGCFLEFTMGGGLDDHIEEPIKEEEPAAAKVACASDVILFED